LPTRAELPVPLKEVRAIEPPQLTDLGAVALLTGTVRDSRGRPVGGAHLVQAGAEVACDARTDPAGEYSLQLRWVLGDRPPLVTVAADGFQPKSRQVDADLLRAGTARLTMDFELSEGCHVRGRVVSAAGSPVDGARILVTSDDPGDQRLYRTSNDGAFDFGRSGGGAIVISVAHGLVGHASRHVEVSDGVQTLADFVLAQLDPLTLRFQFEDGSAVAALPVSVRAVNADLFKPGEGAAIWHSTTDAGGECRFLGLAKGPYRVSLQSAVEKSLKVVRGEYSSSFETQVVVVGLRRVLVDFYAEGREVSPSLVELAWTCQSDSLPDGHIELAVHNDRYKRCLLVPVGALLQVRARLLDGEHEWYNRDIDLVPGQNETLLRIPLR